MRPASASIARSVAASAGSSSNSRTRSGVAVGLPYADHPSAADHDGRNPARGLTHFRTPRRREHPRIAGSGPEHRLVEPGEEAHGRGRRGVVQLVEVVCAHPRRLSLDVDRREHAGLAELFEPVAELGLPGTPAREPGVERFRSGRAVGPQVCGDRGARGHVRLRNPGPVSEPRPWAGERHPVSVARAVAEQSHPCQRLEQGAPA